MRIIGGQFRSRRLRSLRGLEIRPTSDRLRETLFDVLTAGNPQLLRGSVWIDLYAGTGAVGIEALSRGAAMVYFVESSKPAIELIRSNLNELGIQNSAKILPQKAARAIGDLERQQLRANFVFLDPPYSHNEEYRRMLSHLGESAVVAQALVVAEHEKKFDPGDHFGKLRRARKLEQGDAALSFYRTE